MIVPILVSVLVCLLLLGGGVAIWFLLRQRRVIKSREPVRQTTTGSSLAFHWGYIIAPVVILFVAVVVTAYFYHLLPVEVAYHFESDGSPDKWLGRGTIILAMLLPQLFFTLLAAAVTWGITKLSGLFSQSEGTRIKPERVLMVMGNMIVLPQIILCFAMLDIFSYNSYQIHLIPLWVFALIVMVLGGIVLGIFFVQAVLRAWRTTR